MKYYLKLGQDITLGQKDTFFHRPGPNNIYIKFVIFASKFYPFVAASSGRNFASVAVIKPGRLGKNCVEMFWPTFFAAGLIMRNHTGTFRDRRAINRLQTFFLKAWNSWPCLEPGVNCGCIFWNLNFISFHFLISISFIQVIEIRTFYSFICNTFFASDHRAYHWDCNAVNVSKGG